MTTPKPEGLTERANRAMPGGVTSYARAFDRPLNFVRAEGSKIYDESGTEYVDFLNAWGAVVFGHCDPRVNGAAAAAADEEDLFGYGSTDLEVEAAELIREHVPSAEKVLFGCAGTEVVAHGLRLARSATGRRKIVKFQGHYHGWYDPVACNQLSDPADVGSIDPFGDGVLPEAYDDTIVLPFNDEAAVRRAFRKHGDDIAAVILEPVVHNMGCVTPNDGYLQFLRDITAEHGSLLFFDEIITGVRHGLGGVQEREGVTPDLTTVGKSVANGYPVSVLCGAAEYMDQFKTAGGDVQFGGTYNGHAASMAATTRTIELFEEHDYHDRLFETTDRLADGMADVVADLGIEATVERYGSVYLTYFTDESPENYRDVAAHDTETYRRFRRGMIDEGIMMVPSDARRNYVTVSHTDEDVRRTLETAEEVLRAVAR